MQITITQEHIDQGIRGRATKCPVALALKSTYAQVECHPTVGYHAINIAFQHNRMEFTIRSNLSNWIADFDSLKRVKPITVSLNLRQKTARIIKDNS